MQSALGAALNGYHYGNDDLFGIAASYAFHIAQAQAFLIAVAEKRLDKAGMAEVFRRAALSAS